MEEKYRYRIAEEFLDCVRRTVKRVEGDDGTNRPFHSALLSEEALFWSRFERSFSTSFGQSVIERISMLAAESNGASRVGSQTVTMVSLYESQIQAINSHISALRGPGTRGSWATDVLAISSVPKVGEIISERVISDISWLKNGVENYMSIKTVKPNIDQTAEAKRDLLRLVIDNPNRNVYFGLYYNPFGEDLGSYNWSPPKKIFDFINDKCVLIGRDYWETLGGPGFYDELLKIVESVGAEARKMIQF